MTEGERRLAAIMFTDVVGYTTLTEQDEPKAIQIRERHRDLVRPLVARFQGQVIDATGDEILSVFPSSLLAVDCALAVQASLRDDPDLKLRIGIHLGDILMRDAEVAGEGVNVASRIRPLADPGGIAVSGEVYGLVRNRSYISGRPLGSKSLKNVSQPVEVFALDAGRPQQGRRRNRWIAALVCCVVVLAVGYGLYAANRGAIHAYLMLTLPKYIGDPIEQHIGFAKTSDGVQIAYATTGKGPPVVMVLGWATHLERGFGSPLYDFQDTIRWMSRRHLYVRYDGRGFGLSDREVTDFSLDARVRDVEAIVDTLGFEHFSIFALSSGGPISIAYAVRHPERVSRMVLLSCEIARPYEGGHPVIKSERQFDAVIDMFRSDWHSEIVRGMMVDLIYPGADEAFRRLTIEFLRIAGDGSAMAGFHGTAVDAIELAPRVEAPTLVLHARDDLTIPFSQGRHLASLIPNAELKILEGGHAPATPDVLRAITDFLAEGQLSPRLSEEE